VLGVGRMLAVPVLAAELVDRGAPARIATPIPELATLTRLSEISLSCMTEIVDLRRQQHDNIGDLTISDALAAALTPPK
jgi:hypothetical protein